MNKKKLFYNEKYRGANIYEDEEGIFIRYITSDGPVDDGEFNSVEEAKKEVDNIRELGI